MVHPFFARVVKRPQDVDNWLSLPNSPLFTTVFKNLFPPGGWYSPSVLSYLNAISEWFYYSNDIRIPRGIRNNVWNFFVYLGFDDPNSDTDFHVFQFWTYLVHLYNCGYCRPDNFFGFMQGFPVHATKVVIVGQDPSFNFESSGYAFHGSPCPSTQHLVDLVNQEMRRVEVVLSGGIGGGVSVPCRMLEQVKQNCDLFSWIRQNVLLLNSWLSPEGCLWDSFSDFLVGYLSSQLNNVVFILMGQTAMDKAPLIDCRNHFIIRVHHPGHLLRRTFSHPDTAHLEWDRVMPFVNTNFYFYQLSRLDCMVDWSNFSWGTGGGRPSRQWNNAHYQQYISLFELAIQTKRNKESVTGKQEEDAYIYVSSTNEVALAVRRCRNGLLILRKAYHWNF